MAILSGDEFIITKIENVEHVNTLLRPNRIVNFNRFAHGFVYKISGEVNYHFKDTTLHFTPGCICYFPKGSDFNIENIVLGECIAVNFQTYDNLDIPPFCISLDKNNQMKTVFQKLEILWHKRKCDFSYDILSEVYKIADYIQESLKESMQENKAYKNISEIAAFLQENFNDPDLKISDVCNKFSVSVSSARENFSKMFGMSPKRYLTTLRINFAKNLLLESDLTISQIAEKSGFEDTFYFSRCFSRECGCCPTEYRKIKASL